MKKERLTDTLVLVGMTWQYVTIYRYDNPESCRPACLDLIFPSLLLYEKLQF